MSLLVAAAVISAGQTFTCTPTRVWDGDAPIWCAEGPRIRLSGIAARDADGPVAQASPAPMQVQRDLVMLWSGFPVSLLVDRLKAMFS